MFISCSRVKACNFSGFVNISSETFLEELSPFNELRNYGDRIGSDIRPVGLVRNLGLWFDHSMTMRSHVGKVCSKAFRSLYNLCQIRKFLSEDSTKTLIHAFVTSYLDY